MKRQSDSFPDPSLNDLRLSHPQSGRLEFLHIRMAVMVSEIRVGNVNSRTDGMRKHRTSRGAVKIRN